MSMSTTLERYLGDRQIAYDLIPHKRTDTAFNAAKTAHIPAKQMVKGVLLQDDRGYLMAAMPANRRLALNDINRMTHRHLQLVSEEELARILSGCEAGAVPALGEAYGIETVWDEQLAFQSDFYIEAGDHRELVHLSHASFRELMPDAHRAEITH